MKTAPPRLPSERKFGALFIVVFAILAAWAILRGHAWVGWISSGLCAATAAATLFAPRLLAPANAAWFRLGQLLGAVFSPVVLAVMFFAIITPTALIGRLAGRDVLRRRKGHVDSYWVRRDPPGPDGQSLNRQF